MQSIEDKTFHKIYSLNEIYNEYDAILFDIWGVLHEGADLYSGVKEIFNKISKEKIVRIISNAPRLKETVIKNLESQGLDIEVQNIFTSGEITRLMLCDPKKHLNIESPIVYHIGGDRNTEILDQINVELTDNIRDSNLILLSAFRDIGENINDIIHLLEIASEHKIPALCANPDKEVLHLNQIRKCPGFFADIYEELNGHVFYAGKPENLIFDECIKSFNSSNKKILMIGDTFHTDVLGAKKSNIDSALVLTGNMSLLMKSQNLDPTLDNINKVLSKQKHLPDILLSVS
jgi:HAD superfamily hydrolase (TIGR01459 family)